MSDLNDILSFGDEQKGSSKKISEDKLQAYLEGRLPVEEQHEVELWLSQEGMESDAMDGLRQIDPRETKKAVGRLNYQLRTHLTRKKRARKLPITENKWAWMAVFLILILCALAYLILHVAVKK